MSTYLAPIYRQFVVVLDPTSASPLDAPSTVGAYSSTTSEATGTAALPSTEVFIWGTLVASVPIAWKSELVQEYRELGEALAELVKLEADDESHIEPAVFRTVCFVANELMVNLLPVPQILTHGPKSVVFNWSNGSDDLYLTISTDHLSALVSSPERIKRRTEWSVRTLMDPALFLSSIRKAYLQNPPTALIEGILSEEDTVLAGA